MFKLTSILLENIKLQDGLRTPEAGAFASFEGIVRNRHDGKPVSYLEYQAQETLCGREANKILAEIREQFPVLNVRCYHRVGRCEIGEMAVWVGVAAAHRDEAFKACRYIIDEIKHRLPIWKKEFYQDGTSVWVQGDHGRGHQAAGGAKQTHGPRPRVSGPELSDKDYYARQINLPEIGEAGQKKLKNAKVLVVGAGGLGCPALMSLAGAGVGTVGICEQDKVELSNLHRQFLYTFDDVGRHKIEIAAQKIQMLNPSIDVRQHDKKLTAENVLAVIEDYDVLLDCTDNIETKYILNDACYLTQKTLVQAGIYQWEGQLRVMLAGQKGCLRCLWPQVPDPACVGTCTDGGVLGVIPNLFGHLQAMETLRIILGMQMIFENELLIFNVADFQFRRLKLRPEENCPLCSAAPSIEEIQPEHYQSSPDYLVDAVSLTGEELKAYKLIDVREAQEREDDPFDMHESGWMPVSEFTEESIPFEKDERYLLFCAKGVRSSRLAAMVRELGYDNVFSLKDGLVALRNIKKESAA